MMELFGEIFNGIHPHTMFAKNIPHRWRKVPKSSMYSKNRIFLLLCGTSKDFINAFKLLIKVFALSQISAKRIPEKLNFAMLLEVKK